MRSAFCRLAFVALFAATACAATGCGNEQETINRVQPNAVEKSAFDGEWYYLQTVIDTPAGTPYTFVGDQSGARKIKWEIQEDFLIARRSYDLIAGAEQQGPDPLNDAANTVLAKFRISSHFDIRRDYNPATGEETNVISENTVDRPWNEREFMRVDWAENLVNDGDFMTLKQALDGLQVESSYFVQSGEDAPKFEKGEDGLVNYMDIVNKAFIRPTTVDIPGYGPIPTCFLNGHELDLCQDVEVSVRNSFLKVQDRDYQPVLYTGDRMEKFGFFVDERKGYSRDYGFIEGERARFAQRHNIWMKSHRTNDAGERLKCTTDKECDDKKGSVCDTAWGLAHREYAGNGSPQGLCTIPYREREIRPIVYYMSANHPADLAADADNMAEEWNQAFVATVSSLRENECLAHGGNAKSCAAERARKDHQKIFHICTTPVAEGAPEACGAAGLTPKPGDLRYSQIVWVSSEETGGPLGYGPGHSDPETGETLIGNAFMYGAGVEKYAAYGRDLVKVLNGDMSPEEVQAGDYITAWAQIGHAREGANEHKHAIEMTPEILARDVKNMDFSWATSDAVQTPPRNAGELKAALKRAKDSLYQAGAFGPGVDTGAARLKRLVGTDIEAMMVTPEMRMAAGLDPRETSMSDEVLKGASPLRGMSLDTIRAIERARQIIREKIGYYDADFQDEGLVGLAIEIRNAAAKGGTIKWYGREYAVSKTKGKIDYDAVRKMIFHPMYHGLTLHEVGHSIGLRHNFSGSFDAVNYHSEYWDLRDDGKMAPRLWDPITEEETKGRIREYQYSTVMDYGNNFIVTDSSGIGHYDMAAIKMGYGDMVEVFAEVPDVGKVASVSFIQGAGYPIMLDVFSGTNPKAYVYTDWPSLVGGRANIQKRIDVPYTSLKPEPMLAQGGIADNLIDAAGRPMVPYLFCSDEQADLNPDCMRYDAGADAYESVTSIVDSYWYYYPFINFRRQRLGFDVGKTVERIHGRYFEKVKRAHQTYALYRPIFKDIFNVADDAPFWTAQDGMGAWSAAADVGFKLLQHVVTAPEPGSYAEANRADGTPLLSAAGQGALLTAGTVDQLDGRFLETTWDFDAGYYWFDQLDRVGYFYDKVYALMTLVDPTTYFINRDTDADIRKYQINYATTFGPSVTSLFRAMMSEDWVAAAPRLENGVVVYPELDEIEKRSMDGTPMAPNVSFSIQLYAAVFGMAYIPQTYDQDFLNSSRVWVEGGAEQIELDPTLPLVTFSDPDSGMSYSAVSYVDEAGIEQGVGASLLAYANTLSAKAAGKDLAMGTADDDLVARETMNKFVDNVDIVRRLTWQLGFGAQP